jgi:hypothetical protein
MLGESCLPQVGAGARSASKAAGCLSWTSGRLANQLSFAARPVQLAVPAIDHERDAATRQRFAHFRRIAGAQAVI